MINIFKATNSATNTWSTSLLNKTNLNQNFITNIGTEWAEKIATTTWKDGGNTYANIGDAVPSVTYQNEITNAVTTNTTDGKTEYSAKIGLMYVSDYGFAADPSAWTRNILTYTSQMTTNWMYMGLSEWTISRNAGTSVGVLIVRFEGSLNGDAVYSVNCVRPSFYLLPSISYASGDGTINSPIRIN